MFGDPHYKTFDGKVFNFQGSCKYLLTKDCSVKEANSSNAFSIRITNDARDTVAYRWTLPSSTFIFRTALSENKQKFLYFPFDYEIFSWLRTVTVRMGTTKVSLLQKMRVKVDGKKVTLPYIKLGVLSVMRDGYRVILRTNGGEWILISEGVREGIKKPSHGIRLLMRFWCR